MNNIMDMYRWTDKSGLRSGTKYIQIKDGKAIATDAFRLLQVETDISEGSILGEECRKSIHNKTLPNILPAQDNYPVIEPLWSVGASERKITVKLNADYLKELTRYVSKHGVNKHVTMTVIEGNNPILFQATTKEGKQIKSLIMPIQL